MIDLISEFFRTMAENHPKWNFIFFYEERQWDRVISGLYVTLQLSVVCVLFSVIIGFVGALAQSSPIAAVRWLVNGYIQLFRNTPPMIRNTPVISESMTINAICCCGSPAARGTKLAATSTQVAVSGPTITIRDEPNSAYANRGKIAA